MISIIIPTYNEKANIRRLVPKIFNVTNNIKEKIEVIVVDDNSPDGTSEAVKKLGKIFPVRLLKRERRLGLSSAVVEGFHKARGKYLGVMDADFSHPVKNIPEMIKALEKYDLVIGSRYVYSGGIKDWSRRRRVISRGATLLAKPLTFVKDPMSGFFFLRRDVISGVKMNPRGYKICLEIIVKGNWHVIKEIPYIFMDRKKGKSKMNFKEIWNYFRHVLGLYVYKISHKK